jgi:uncharacterized SAM-binding protein YcdF (DUF218 family)
MAALVSLAKTLLIPGSTSFLIVGVGLALLLLTSPRTAAWGRRWLALLFALYVALSLPLVATLLHRGLSGVSPLTDAQQARGAATIVLLGNGAVSVGSAATALHLPSLNTALNVSETARLYRLLGRRRIIASGGIPRTGANTRPESEVMRDYLARLGVAGEDIALESASTNTTEQAERVAALLPRGARVVLVTAPAHMPRASALFTARGLDVVAAVSGAIPSTERTWLEQLVPNRFALRASEVALYEGLAFGFYRLRGEIRP